MTSFIPTPTGDRAGPTEWLWLARAPATAYPALSGDAAFDVAVMQEAATGREAGLHVRTTDRVGLHFNAAERSWDGPCHGSRFDIDDAVLAGPAVHPLDGRDAS